MTQRATIGALIVAVLLVACSSAPLLSVGLAPSEVGCLVTFGDDPARSIGPIRATRNVTVDISPDTSVSIGNSPAALHITVKRGHARRSVTVRHDEIPTSGYAIEDTWIDAAHPWYEIGCRRG